MMEKYDRVAIHVPYLGRDIINALTELRGRWAEESLRIMNLIISQQIHCDPLLELPWPKHF